MSLSCHVLADDLTGALDCAAAFARVAEVPVALGRLDALPWRAPMEVCATGSRGLPEADIGGRLTGCVDWLAGADVRFKKIDSLLRGNTFAELAWLAGSGRFRRLVFAPAFPAQRRVVSGGRLVVDGVPAALSLRDGLARFGLEMHADGSGRLDGAEIVMPDTLDDGDLDVLVSAFAGMEGVLWCGSAGLAMALARSRDFGAPCVPPQMAQIAPGADVLIATASRHPVLRSQLQHTAAAFEASTPRARVRLEDFSSTEELPPAQAEAALAENAARIVARTVPPKMLVAIGGDSLLALCEAAQVRALVAGVPPRPGWGSARLVGGDWDGVRCLSRSGAFGGPDDLSALLASFGALAPGQTSFESVFTP